MRILLVYPQYPDTFWSFKYALKYIHKKALMPPLGLLTIASMIPNDFETRLIDMNVEKITDKDLKWADCVFISAMITQKNSVIKLIEKCKKCGVKMVAGGPLFTSSYNEFPDIDHFVLNEGEATFPLFLEDLKTGNLKRIYTSTVKPDITASPVPKWSLVKFKNYSKIPIQFSRGCPFDCEFCDIVNLNGRIPRTKKPSQVIKELDALCDRGWNNSVFIVDDNFIGNKMQAKKLLRALIKWRKARRFFPTFMTEVSLNIADDDELLSLMRDAGFDSVFVGLETPSEQGLEECGKVQNTNRNLLETIKKLHSYGLEVSAGFIVGFDSDDLSIFNRQIDFIQKSGVVVAMIGLLQALPGTKLYERLKSENRLLSGSSGNNTDFTLNFLPKIDGDALIKGYKNILSSIYSTPEYYERVLTFLKDYTPYNYNKFNFDFFIAFIKSMLFLGIFEKGQFYYWKLFFISLFKYPKSFPKAIGFTVYHVHFRRIFPELAKNR